jgi:hypothetical protein
MDFYERKIAPTMREAKYCEGLLSLKHIEENGVFAGYASVFDVVDSQRDVVLRGAFADSLTARQGEIKLLWQHDMREPIGIIEELREDERGLYLKGRLLMEVARAREAYALMKTGAVRGLSIGYSPRRFRVDPDSGVRMLAAVDLWEVSLVTFPANAAATVTVVKSAATHTSAHNEIRLLRALTRAEAALHSLVENTA